MKNRDAIVVGEVIVVQNLRVRGVDGSRRLATRLAVVTRLASGNTMRAAARTSGGPIYSKGDEQL